MGIKGMVVAGFRAESGALVVAVRPRWQRPRCSHCGRKGRSAYDERGDRRWRHLDFGGVRVELSYGLRRVDCVYCGVVAERVPWSADPVSRFTTEFEEQTAWLAQRMDQTGVQKLMGVAWRSVGRIVERVVARLRPRDDGATLRAIGVDELAYRKQHHYVTLVTDHGTARMVWGKEGRSAETLAAFFDGLGAEKCAAIEVVTMDMSGAYIKAVRDKLPQAQIVFDRFHVQRLASDALDETRRSAWREHKGTDEGDGIKHMRWVLLKNRESLKQDEVARLDALEQANAPLYRGYLLKETLGDILGRKQINVMSRELRHWIDDARASGLAAFARAAGTIETHFDGIVAYARWRVSNGLVEGLNNKARLLTRRAYGFHSAASLLAMIELCCGGIELDPVSKSLLDLALG